MGHVTAHSALPFLPFKGRTEVGHVTAHSALPFLPFKGRTEVGMGSSMRSIKPIPIPVAPSPLRLLSPLKGKEFPGARDGFTIAPAS